MSTALAKTSSKLSAPPKAKTKTVPGWISAIQGLEFAPKKESKEAAGARCAVAAKLSIAMIRGSSTGRMLRQVDALPWESLDDDNLQRLHTIIVDGLHTLVQKRAGLEKLQRRAVAGRIAMSAVFPCALGLIGLSWVWPVIPFLAIPCLVIVVANEVAIRQRKAQMSDLDDDISSAASFVYRATTLRPKLNLPSMVV